MKFDFTTIYDRRGKDAMAVDAVEKIPVFQPNEGFDAIPMWVADMNFATAPAVTEAIRKRLEHPLFGYFMTSDEKCLAQASILSSRIKSSGWRRSTSATKTAYWAGS